MKGGGIKLMLSSGLGDPVVGQSHLRCSVP